MTNHLNLTPSLNPSPQGGGKGWYELLDTGEGYRLERYGEIILKRPDPQIIWEKHLPESEWEKAHAEFVGDWKIKKKFHQPWEVSFNDVKFLARLTPFKHTGIFPEQAANWVWMKQRLKDPSISSGQNPKRILNLFAYTGAATVVLAKSGHFVTHVDSSKPAITWANENHKLNNLPPDSVRWILDDAMKFVKREVKRGTRYDGVLMDPPAFGHSPTGKTWKFNRDLPELLSGCVQLLSDNAKFILVNGYATNSSALALKNLLEDSLNPKNATVEFGELCLAQRDGRMISTGIFARSVL